MRVVIVGGHDCMVCRYKEICKSYKCKAKVFTQMPSDLRRKIGKPDVVILFTSTVSHKMVHNTVSEAKKCNACILRCHSSSGSALANLLEEYTQSA